MSANISPTSPKLEEYKKRREELRNSLNIEETSSTDSKISEIASSRTPSPPSRQASPKLEAYKERREQVETILNTNEYTLESILFPDRHESPKPEGKRPMLNSGQYDPRFYK